MTWGTQDEHSPQFAGGARAISFLSARGDPRDSDQLWLLSMDGGEARKLTSIKDGIGDYFWSPDGKRVVLALHDSTANADSAPHPIVLDRYQFMQDIEGYLDKHRVHLSGRGSDWRAQNSISLLSVPFLHSSVAVLSGPFGTLAAGTGMDRYGVE
jgi:dipeptidyl aminopeptidase/acylaminoacyl peptidase